MVHLGRVRTLNGNRDARTEYQMTGLPDVFALFYTVFFGAFLSAEISSHHFKYEPLGKWPQWFCRVAWLTIARSIFFAVAFVVLRGRWLAPEWDGALVQILLLLALCAPVFGFQQLSYWLGLGPPSRNFPDNPLLPEDVKWGLMAVLSFVPALLALGLLVFCPKPGIRSMAAYIAGLMNLDAEFTVNVAASVVGGAITVAVIEAAKGLVRRARRWRLRAVFGEEVSTGDIHLVYAHLSLSPIFDSAGQPVTHPYLKRRPRAEHSGTGISIQTPVSSCELRGAAYLSELFAREFGHGARLSSDESLEGRLDVAFISFGGPAPNYKTGDAIANNGNHFVAFGPERLVSKKSGKDVFVRDQDFDYGLVMKIHPSQFPRKTWIVCAGFGEWGTSGAAWYLANKWREIYKYAGSGCFAIVVRVTGPQDESAEPVLKLKSSADTESVADAGRKGDGARVGAL